VSNYYDQTSTEYLFEPGPTTHDVFDDDFANRDRVENEREPFIQDADLFELEAARREAIEQAKADEPCAADAEKLRTLIVVDRKWRTVSVGPDERGAKRQAVVVAANEKHRASILESQARRGVERQVVVEADLMTYVARVRAKLASRGELTRLWVPR
jgi:hypothetical protein